MLLTGSALRRGAVNKTLVIVLALLVIIGGGFLFSTLQTKRQQVVADSAATLTLYCLECKAETPMSLEEAKKLSRGGDNGRYICPKCNKPGGTFEKPGTVAVMTNGG